MKLTKSLIKADIIAATQAIEYFEANKIRDIKNIAAYHLQQASEKLVKYQIYESGIVYNNRAVYKHDIKALIMYSESLDITIDIPKYIRTNADIISDWEAGSRYDISFSVRIDTLKKALNIIQDWYERI